MYGFVCHIKSLPPRPLSFSVYLTVLYVAHLNGWTSSSSKEDIGTSLFVDMNATMNHGVRSVWSNLDMIHKADFKSLNWDMNRVMNHNVNLEV